MFRVCRKIREYYGILGFTRLVAFLTAMVIAKIFGRWFLFLKPDKWMRFNMPWPGSPHPVRLRLGTTDIEVYKQVLLDQEYDFALPSAPKVIVDAGANIGLAAVYFANKFPGSAIFALEPEETNFRLLQQNTSPYPQIRPLHVALWNENKPINLFDPHGGHCGFRTTESEPETGRQVGMVQAVTLDALMKDNKMDNVDLLKVDIEGAEIEVFKSSSNWINKVKVIMAELHEQYRAGCDNAFLEATKDFQPGVVSGQTITRIRAGNSA
jgi:FkbM family methyltransferase